MLIEPTRGVVRLQLCTRVFRARDALKRYSTPHSKYWHSPLETIAAILTAPRPGVFLFEETSLTVRSREDAAKWVSLRLSKQFFYLAITAQAC